MSEQVTAPSGSSATPTAGQMLRELREASGIHAAALAGSLKVPLRQLEALEHDRIDQLPDAVFARGLAASICRHLKSDPQPVLALMPHDRPRLTGEADGLNQPFRVPGVVTGQGWRELLLRPPVLAALALVVGALLLLVLPPLFQSVSSDGAAGAASAPMVPASTASAAAMPASSTEGLVVETVTPAGMPASAPVLPAAPASAR